jgi:flavin-dependent dehydrogenase
LDKTPDWAPGLRNLISGSDPTTVNVVRVRSASPVAAWATGPVTLLGDAIHNMTPMGGIGANTALRDADLLRRQLITVSRNELPLIPAIHAYEARMLDYGFAAVKSSLRNARQAGSASRLGRIMFRGDAADDERSTAAPAKTGGHAWDLTHEVLPKEPPQLVGNNRGFAALILGGTVVHACPRAAPQQEPRHPTVGMRELADDRLHGGRQDHQIEQQV